MFLFSLFLSLLCHSSDVSLLGLVNERFMLQLSAVYVLLFMAENFLLFSFFFHRFCMRMNVEFILKFIFLFAAVGDEVLVENESFREKFLHTVTIFAFFS